MGSTFRKRGTVSIFYSYSDYSSGLAAFALTSTQVGFEIAWQLLKELWKKLAAAGGADGRSGALFLRSAVRLDGVLHGQPVLLLHAAHARDNRVSHLAPARPGWARMSARAGERRRRRRRREARSSRFTSLLFNTGWIPAEQDYLCVMMLAFLLLLLAAGFASLGAATLSAIDLPAGHVAVHGSLSGDCE